MSAKTFRPSRPRYAKRPASNYHSPRTKVRPSSRSDRKLIRPLFWLLALLIFFVVIYFLTRRFFVVRRVGCIINRTNTPCSASLWEAAHKLQGQPLLFADFATILESAHTEGTDFDYVTYYKILPDSVIADYHFPSPVYSLSIGDGSPLGFSLDGRYTIATGEADLIHIRSHYAPLNERLAQFGVDELLHQKFLELDFYSRGHRDNWQWVTLYSRGHMQIATPNAVYDVDPFQLDENLQKLYYVEKNRHSDKYQEIDLRLNVPVVRDLVN